MTEFTLESAVEMTNDQLRGVLAEGFREAEAGLKKACVAVATLEDRGVDLPVLPAVFAHARNIADGNLSAHAGWLLASIPGAIRCILPLPVDLQDEIADGRKFMVAVKKDGRITHENMTIFQMSQGQIRLVFSERGVIPVADQGAMLHRAADPETVPDAPKVKVSVDADKKEIVVNRTHLRLADLEPALNALGFRLQSIRTVK